MRALRNKIEHLASWVLDTFSLFVALIIVIPIAGIASIAIGFTASNFFIGFVSFIGLIAFSLVALSRR